MTDDRSVMPYHPPTRQVEGRISERKVLKQMGARVHPNSGAGHIKHDGSDDETLYELKDAGVSHTMKASDLEVLRVRAARQGKDAVYIVTFANGVKAECRISK